MLIGMDATVASYLRTPQTLDVLVKKTLEEQPEYITQLQRIMNAYAPKDHPASRKEHQTITQIHD